MEWTRGPTIGRGSSATVSLATTLSGDLIAVKSTELSHSSFLQREQHFLSQLSSPYVTRYMGFDVTYENNHPMYNLFMEYAPGGTISDMTKKQGGSLDESTIRSYTSQILQGLDYLHLNNLVHCDIKGQNILMGKDCVKICDLGCAKLVENGGVATSAFSGTPVFMAPEVARGEEQGFPADVWALGCTVIEMATGCNPWPEVNDPVSALYKIGYSGDVPEFPRWLSDEGKDFLSKCLKIDSNERWTAKELLQHPFVDNLESNFEKSEEFVRKSPTSILDQGFWDSLEVSGDPTKFSDSPVDRIRQLIGCASSSLPNWTDEEDWITIRGNQMDEISKHSKQNCDMNWDDSELSCIDTFVFSVVDVEELESSIGGDVEVLVDREYCPVSIRTHLPVLSCESVNLFLDFENKINEKHILFNSGVPPSLPFAGYAALCCSLWVDE